MVDLLADIQTPLKPATCGRGRTWPRGEGDGAVRSGLSFRPPKLPKPRQPVQVVRTGPHPPPPVPLRREPAARPVRPLRAMVRLHRAVVDHGPAPHRLDDEARVTVAGLGHRAHGARVDALCSRPNPEAERGWTGHLTPPTGWRNPGPVVTFITRSASPVLIQRRWGFTAVMARGDSRGFGSTNRRPSLLREIRSPALIQRLPIVST